MIIQVLSLLQTMAHTSDQRCKFKKRFISLPVKVPPHPAELSHILNCSSEIVADK